MEQQIILALIASREIYDKLDGNLDAKGTFSPIGQFWYGLISDWYKRDSKARRCDVQVLRETAKSRLATHKDRDTLLGLLDSPESETSPANVYAAVQTIRRNNLCMELASAVSGDKRDKAEKIFRELEQVWGQAGVERDEVVEALPVSDLFSVVSADKRIRLWPKQLNDRINGGCLTGHHVVVFGYPEIGKSTFMINLLAGFVHDKHKVLYIGNEDQINLLKLRAVGRIIRKKYDDVCISPSKSIEKFIELGGEEYLVMVQMHPGTVTAIRKQVEKHEPKILIIDQIRNLASEQDGMTQKLESNGILVRNLLNEFGLVGISVTQAGNRTSSHASDSPIWLGIGDVDSSRVGLPATADLQLGIGGNADMIARGQRAISICKNKLASGPQSREGFICQFDLQTGVVS